MVRKKSTIDQHTLEQEQGMIIHDPVFVEAIMERLNRSGMLVLNEDGKCVYVSARAEQVLSVVSKDLLGKDFMEYMPLQNMEGTPVDTLKHPVYQALNVKMYTQTTPFFFHRTECPDEPLAMNVLQVKKGAKLFAVVVQIRRAQREVQIGEMKSLFVSFAAHQLKTPSSVVKGFLELMMRSGQKSYSAEQWHFLTSAFESNEQLIHVSKTLLNMARLDGGLIEPHLRTFSPHVSLESKISSLAPLQKLKELKVVLKTDGKSELVSDESFFTEVFEILYSNAMKHSPNGTTIIVTARSTKHGVEFAVKDEGRGIAPEVQKKLFQEKQSAHSDTNSHGLGLYMAKKYIALMGGSIRLESDKKGSKFIVTIPNAVVK